MISSSTTREARRRVFSSFQGKFLFGPNKIGNVLYRSTSSRRRQFLSCCHQGRPLDGGSTREKPQRWRSMPRRTTATISTENDPCVFASTYTCQHPRWVRSFSTSSSFEDPGPLSPNPSYHDGEQQPLRSERLFDVWPAASIQLNTTVHEILSFFRDDHVEHHHHHHHTDGQEKPRAQPGVAALSLQQRWDQQYLHLHRQRKGRPYRWLLPTMSALQQQEEQATIPNEPHPAQTGLNNLSLPAEGVDESLHLPPFVQTSSDSEVEASHQDQSTWPAMGDNQASSQHYCDHADQAGWGDQVPPSLSGGTFDPEKLEDSFARALALLRSMSEKDWSEYDLEENDVASQHLVKGSSTSEMDQTHLLARDVVGEEDQEVKEADDTNETDWMEDWLARTQQGLVPPNVDSFNLILAQTALSTRYFPDEILEKVMETYVQMDDLAKAGLQASKPNALSYEILLLCLKRRLSAFKTADLLLKDIIGQHLNLSPELLEASMELCETKKLFQHSQRLMRQVEKQGDSALITGPVFHAWLRLLKSDDRRAEAMDAVKFFLQNRSGYRSQETIDSVIINVINWPTRRSKEAIDNTSVLSDLLGIIEANRSYTPQHRVWRQFVMACTKGDQPNDLRWKLAQRALKHLFCLIPEYWVDRVFLKHALDVCFATKDCGMTARLIARHLEPGNTWSRENEGANQSQKLTSSFTLPYKDIYNSMSFCIQQGDMAECHAILDTVVRRKASCPPLLVKELFLLTIRGYASRGDYNMIESMGNEMDLEKLNLREELYNARMQGYALGGRHDQACSLLALLSEEASLLSPGPLTFEYFFLSCIKSAAYDDAGKAEAQMKASKVRNTSLGNQYLLEAYLCAGNIDSARQLITDMINTEAEISADTCSLALGAFIPNFDTEKDVKEQIRSMAEQQPSLKELFIDVLREVRSAEAEKYRSSTATPRSEGAEKQRQNSLRAVLKNIMALDAAVSGSKG